MSIDALVRALPDYAEDLAANLKTLADETVLDEQRRWGCFIASANASGSAAVVAALTDGCPLSDKAMRAAKAAAAVTVMNDVYYRATNLLSEREYAPMPVKLKMGAIADPGVDRVDFELWCLSVSAIDGCGMGLDGHESELRLKGVPGEQVQAAIRIAAVVAAVARVMLADGGPADEARPNDRG